MARTNPIREYLRILRCADKRHGAAHRERSTGIEAISLIHERGSVFLIVRFLPEHSLATIGIAGPFIESEHSRKCFQIAYAREAETGM